MISARSRWHLESGERPLPCTAWRSRTQPAALAGNPRMTLFQRALDESYRNFVLAARDADASPELAALFYEVVRDLTSCLVSMLPTQRRLYAYCAIETLRIAITTGFRDLDRLQKDAALAPLRSRADFQQLLTKDPTPVVPSPR